MLHNYFEKKNTASRKSLLFNDNRNVFSPKLQETTFLATQQLLNITSHPADEATQNSIKYAKDIRGHGRSKRITQDFAELFKKNQLILKPFPTKQLVSSVV